MQSWQVSNFEGGHLLLDALALRLPAAPRAFLHQLVRKGRVRYGDRALAADEVVASGTLLTILPSTRLAELVGLCGIPPQTILYEDQHALVIYKPAGLAVHQAVGHDDNLTSRAAHFLDLRRAPYRAAPVHRLDIGTSGPVLFGKGRPATGQYGRLLMAGRISKGYLALVAGEAPTRGELTTPVPEGGVLKPSLTRYRLLSAAGAFCLLELDLLTGRPHQARRQLANAGWPIVGDRRYGGPARPGLEHPFLHCHRLCFPSLDTDELRRVACPLPPPLTEILAATGLNLTMEFAVSAENAADFHDERL
ncbi:MAG: RluA family pseudouridine synthase [Desulfuromonadales bacterium]|nr:RluA family pseudouridine synthase [Desulfuromonadales bacterium]